MRMLGKKDPERTKHSLGHDLTRHQSLPVPDSCSARRTSMTPKSFSHELGPRGGIRASNLRARSYSDLKVSTFIFFLIILSFLLGDVNVVPLK